MVTKSVLQMCFVIQKARVEFIRFVPQKPRLGTF